MKIDENIPSCLHVISQIFFSEIQCISFDTVFFDEFCKVITVIMFSMYNIF